MEPAPVTMEAIKASLRPTQIQRLDEVAAGMLNVYRTLVRMEYLEDAWVHEGPHDVDAFLPGWRQQGIADSIAYLYSVLPYVNGYGNKSIDFVFGGIFAGFPQGDMTGYRNPASSDDSREHLRPWMTMLSFCGEKRGALIYDARRHVIGIYEQIEYGTNDPNYTIEHELLTYASDEDEDEYNGDSDVDDNDDDDDDEPYCEECYWDEMKGRHAAHVLQDIVLWYENLTHLPGGGDEGDGEWSSAFTRSLYIKHGWPHNFDGTAFLVDQVKSQATKRAEQDPKKNILVRISRFRKFLQAPPQPPENEMTMTEDGSVEIFWAERWRRFHNERSRFDVPIMIQELERAYELPSDPLVRLLKQLRAGIRHWEKKLSSGSVMEHDHWPGSEHIRLAYTEKCLDIEKRSYEESKAELGGDAFFAQHDMAEEDLDPEKDLNREKSLDPELQERSRLHIEAARGWLVRVPQEAPRARKMAEAYIKKHEANL